MKPIRLINELIEHSTVLNSDYTVDQHKAWAMGFLASIACEKNHMDNRVWSNIAERIDMLYDNKNNNTR